MGKVTKGGEKPLAFRIFQFLALISLPILLVVVLVNPKMSKK
jgi:hypothetical protein